MFKENKATWGVLETSNSWISVEFPLVFAQTYTKSASKQDTNRAKDTLRVLWVISLQD
jgi:hypothetical protein